MTQKEKASVKCGKTLKTLAFLYGIPIARRSMHHVLKAWCFVFCANSPGQGTERTTPSPPVEPNNTFGFCLLPLRYGHCRLLGSKQGLNIMLHRIKHGFHAQKCRNLLPCFRLMTKTPTDLRLARYLPLLSPLPLYYKALPRTRFCGFQISVPVSHIPSSHYAW